MIAAALAGALLLAAGDPQPYAVEVLRPSRRHPQLVLAPRPGDRAALLVRFAAGAVDDGSNPGLTRVAQRTLVEASPRHPYASLVRDLFAADGSLDLDIGIREATFLLEADRRDFDRLAGILLDLLFAPAIDPQGYKRARERAMIDERESSGRSDWIALIAPKVIDQAQYGNAPYGEYDALLRMKPRDVEAHLRTALSPANATIVATGAFDAKALAARAARYSGGDPRALPPPELKTPFSLMLPARKEVYLLAYKTSFGSPERTAAARIASALLEDRVHRVFRERGVGYSELVTPAHRSWLDLFLLVLPAHDPSSLPLGTMLEDEVDLVRSGGFSDAELERNRAWALAELEAAERDPAALARELALGADPAWYGVAVVDRLRSLDRKALEPLFRELLSDSAAIRILYTPRASRRGPIPETFRRSAR